MATIMVGRWVKHGTNKLYKERFDTRLGAIRAGNAAAKKKGKNWFALGPYSLGGGRGYTIRIAPK